MEKKKAYKKKIKRDSFSGHAAKFIKKAKTIDWKENPNGYRTIDYLLAEGAFLNNIPANERRFNIKEVAKKVARNRHYIFELVEKSGTPLYWVLDGNQVAFVTIDPTYKNARARSMKRDMKDLGDKIKSKERKIRFKYPELGSSLPLLKRIITQTNRLLQAPEETK